MRFHQRPLAAMLGILLLAGVAWAQFSSGVQGTVTDESESVIPDAAISLTNLATGVTNSSQTSSAGVYRFASMAPGDYQLQVEADGFQLTAINLRLLTQQTADVNVRLDVQATTERVVVSAEAPILDTADSRVQATIEEETLDDLPLQGRNMLGLAAVAPGVTGYGSVGGGAPGNAPDNFSTEVVIDASGNGRNSAGNLYTVDGLNVTSNIIQGVANLAPNPDSIQEVAIQTNTFSVEQANASSIQVAITTKTGTNEFHGSGSWYFTNQHLWAPSRLMRDTSPRTEYRPFKKHLFNGTFGGPIIPNKTFFFASAEGLASQISQSDSVRTFETEEFVNWARSAFPQSLGTQILSDRRPDKALITGVNSTAADVFARGETGCGTAATAFIPCDLPMINEGRFTSNPFRNGLQYNARFDQYLNKSKDRIYFNLYKTDLDLQTLGNRRGFATTDNNFTDSMQGSWTRTISPSFLNEFSFGWIRVEGQRGFNPSTDGEPIPFNIPNIGIQGQSLGVSPAWGPAAFIQNNFNWRNVVTVLKGSHTLKVGGSGWWGDDDARFDGAFGRTSLGFNNLLELVQDRPFSQGGPRIDPLTGLEAAGGYHFLLDTFGFFVQDEWKVTPRLTLTLGIRWDDFGNISRNKDIGVPLANIFLSAPFDSLGSGAEVDNAFANARLQFVDEGVYENRISNVLSPRAGFAWDPSGDGNWTVRGGLGLYHDWIPLGEGNRVNGNPPGLIDLSIRRDDKSTPDPVLSIGTSQDYPYGWTLPRLPTLIQDERGGFVGGRSAAGGLDRNLKPSNTYNYNVGVERRIAGSYVLGAMYSGSRTTGGIVGHDYNRFAGDLLDGSFDRLNPSFARMLYETNRNEISYNAMILSLRGRFARNGSLQASYTMSETRDFGQAGSRVNRDPGIATPSQHNLEQFEGASDWDFRNRISMTALYEFPPPRFGGPASKLILGGWEIGTVTILQSGPPFNVVHQGPFADGGDFNADGINFDFPNVPDASVMERVASSGTEDYLKGLFSVADFPVPAPGQLGNLQRHAFRGPGLANVDFTVLKNNRLSESVNMQLRFEFFNVFNRTNLRNVNGSLNSSTFGRSTATFNPRIVQLGARFTF